MAITQSQTPPSTSGAQMANGSYFDDAASPAAAVITVGFVPRYVCVDNVTDRIKIEWYQGMAANTSVKTAAAGTRTLETTNGGITVGTGTSTGTFTISNNATLAVLAQNKQLRWVALA